MDSPAEPRMLHIVIESLRVLRFGWSSEPDEMEGQFRALADGLDGNEKKQVLSFTPPFITTSPGDYCFLGKVKRASQSGGNTLRLSLIAAWSNSNS